MNALAPVSHEGKVLKRSDTVRVVGTPHPLREASVRCSLPAGFTISELIEMASRDAKTQIPRDYIVTLNGDTVPRDMHSRVRPKPGTTVVFQARVAGPTGKILAGLALAITALLAPYAFPAAFAAIGTAFGISAATAGAIAGAGIIVGGTLLLNAIFPVRPPLIADAQAQQRNSAQVYSISGAQNTADPWGPIPFPLGLHRYAPRYGAKVYTEIVGNDQYLRMLFIHGIGPMSLSDHRIGETALADFDDVEVEHRSGYDTDTPLTLFPATVQELALSIELSDPGVWISRTTDAGIDEISVDITAPQGCFQVNKETGTSYSYSVNVQGRYRATGSVGAWTTFMDIAIGGTTQEMKRRGVRVKVARDQYDVEVRRVTAFYAGETTYDDAHPGGHITHKFIVTEGVVWTALRTFTNEHPVNSPVPLAMTAMRIRATDQLNGAIDTYNCLMASRQKVWSVGDNLWNDDHTTNNPGSLIRWVLQHPGNKKAVADEAIDLESLQDFHSFCASNGFAYNTVVDTKRSVRSLLEDIASAGRGSMTFKDGKWAVVWDDPDDDVVVQHFSPRNSSQFSGGRSYSDLPHGLRVPFINEDKDYKPDERLVYADGYNSTNASLFEMVEVPGCTDRDLAWKHGRYRLAERILRPETYQFTSDWQFLVCSRNSLVRVQHDAPKWGQITARVTAVDAGTRTITLDDDVVMTPGTTYGARFRGMAGETIVHRVADQGATPREIILLDAVEDDIEPGVLVQFGEYGNESVPVRIVKIEPQADLRARVTIVDAAPAIYDADTGAIPDFDSHITDTATATDMAPRDFRAAEYVYPLGAAHKTAATLSWQAPSIINKRKTAGAVAGHGGHSLPKLTGYELWMRENSGDNEWVLRASLGHRHTTIREFDLAPGSWSFRVRAIYDNGPPSIFVGSKTLTVSGGVSDVLQLVALDEPPDDVTNFRIGVVGNKATLTWDRVALPNIDHYEIRFAPLIAGVTWSTASILNANAQGPQSVEEALYGTYLIKAVTSRGIQSVNEVSIVSTMPGTVNFNVIEVFQEAPSFAGTKTNCEIDGSNLRLTDPTLPGFYEFANVLDLGDAHPIRLTSSVEALGTSLDDTMDTWESLADLPALSSVDPDTWSVRTSYRKSPPDFDPGTPSSNAANEDGGDLLNEDGGLLALERQWSDSWIEFAVADTIGQMFRYRASLNGSPSNSVSPLVTSLSVSNDMQDRIISDNDVTIPVPGLRVDFDPPFKALKALGVNIQNLTNGEVWSFTAKDETGFTILVTLGGAPVVGTRLLDYQAVGYGEVNA